MFFDGLRSAVISDSYFQSSHVSIDMTPSSTGFSGGGGHIFCMVCIPQICRHFASSLIKLFFSFFVIVSFCSGVQRQHHKVCTIPTDLHFFEYPHNGSTNLLRPGLLCLEAH